MRKNRMSIRIFPKRKTVLKICRQKNCAAPIAVLQYIKTTADANTAIPGCKKSIRPVSLPFMQWSPNLPP